MKSLVVRAVLAVILLGSFYSCSKQTEQHHPQGVYEIQLSENYVTFSTGETGVKIVEVKTDAAEWGYECASEWLIVEKGDGILSFYAPAYERGGKRVAKVWIYGTCCDDKTVEVIQYGDGPLLDSETDVVVFGNNEIDSRNVLITSNISNWQVAVDNDELFIVEKNGDCISITPRSENTGTEVRRATVTVAVGISDSITIEVVQEGI